MAAIKNALIVGGGFSGMCAAIQLGKLGVDVDLVEIDPGWRVYGAGLTITGATLRALKEIGVIDDVLRQGWGANGVTVRDAQGNLLREIPTPNVAGPEFAAGAAIMRPILAKLLAKATVESGANVKLGVSFASIEDRGQAVEVRLTDGSVGSYDLVVGADGLMSKTRTAIFPDAPGPRYTGQGVWRAMAHRPPDVIRTHLYMGDGIKCGFTPVSNEQMYLFVADNRPENEYIDPKDWVSILKGLLKEFGGRMGELRDELNEESSIIYRPLEALLMPQPWYKGRVVLIGDAVHATTPHLGAGAGIGIEDAIVLVQELERHSNVTEALELHQRRRWPRCKLVVENSLQLGEMEKMGTPGEEHSHLMAQSMAALAEPI
jgi:2-polyprenyl-6-methoxyphenol hydroxylase-like FAD-dependent oxidoreductase